MVHATPCKISPPWEALTIAASLCEAGPWVFEPGSRGSQTRGYWLASIIGSLSLRPTDLFTEV
jgi:hypothetical protein